MRQQAEIVFKLHPELRIPMRGYESSLLQAVLMTLSVTNPHEGL